jgi:peptidoglycan hydrolase CwlO-like protein
MENNNPRKDGRRKPQTKKVTNEPKTDAGSPVLFVSIEEHQKEIDSKTSQIIKLENATRAAESIVKGLDKKILDLSNDNRSVRFNVTALTHEMNNLKTKLDSIPGWVKYLFGVK